MCEGHQPLTMPKCPINKVDTSQRHTVCDQNGDQISRKQFQPLDSAAMVVAQVDPGALGDVPVGDSSRRSSDFQGIMTSHPQPKCDPCAKGDGQLDTESRIKILEQEKVTLVRQAEEVLAALSSKYRKECKRSKRLESRICHDAELEKEREANAQDYKDTITELRNLLDSERAAREAKIAHHRSEIQSFRQARSTNTCSSASQTDATHWSPKATAGQAPKVHAADVKSQEQCTPEATGFKQGNSNLSQGIHTESLNIQRTGDTDPLSQYEQLYNEAVNKIAQLESELIDKDTRYRDCEDSLKRATDMRLEKQRQYFQEMIAEDAAKHNQELLKTQEEAEEYLLELSLKHADECDLLIRDAKQLEEKYGKLLEEYNQDAAKMDVPVKESVSKHGIDGQNARKEI
jgi:hypothetical protein